MSESNKKSVVVSESTKAIITAADVVVRMLTNNRADGFRFMTIDFHDHELRESQAVTVKGKVILNEALTEIEVVLIFTKKNNNWLPAPRTFPTAYVDGHEVVFKSMEGGHYSTTSEATHSELLKKWGFTR